MVPSAWRDHFLHYLEGSEYDSHRGPMEREMFPVARVQLVLQMSLAVLLSAARAVSVFSSISITGESDDTRRASMVNSLTLTDHTEMTPWQAIVAFLIILAASVASGHVAFMKGSNKLFYASLLLPSLTGLLSGFTKVVGFANVTVSRFDHLAMVMGWMSIFIFIPNSRVATVFAATSCLVLQSIATLSNGLYATPITITFVVSLSYALHRDVKKLFQSFLKAKEAKAVNYEASLAVFKDLLPTEVAIAFLKNPEAVAGIAEVTVPVLLFTDIVGFTSLASKLGSISTFEALHRMQACFDVLSAYWQAEKLETVGDLTEYRWPSSACASAQSETATSTSDIGISGSSPVPLEAPVRRPSACWGGGSASKDISMPMLRSSTYLPGVSTPPMSFSSGGLPMPATLNATVSGRSNPMDATPHDVQKAVSLGLDLLLATRVLSVQLSEVFNSRGLPFAAETLKIRVGIAVGEVVGGCLGVERPQYSLLGAGVDQALLMEERGSPMALHLNASAAAAWLSLDPHNMVSPCTAGGCRSAEDSPGCGHLLLTNEHLTSKRRTRVRGATAPNRSSRGLTGALRGMIKASSPSAEICVGPSGPRSVAVVSESGEFSVRGDLAERVMTWKEDGSYSHRTQMLDEGELNDPQATATVSSPSNHEAVIASGRWWSWEYFWVYTQLPDPNFCKSHSKAQVILQTHIVKVVSVACGLCFVAIVYAAIMGSRHSGSVPNPRYSLIPVYLFFMAPLALHYARRFERDKAFYLLSVFMMLVNCVTKVLTYSPIVGDPLAKGDMEFYFSPLNQTILYTGVVGMVLASPRAMVIIMTVGLLFSLGLLLSISNQPFVLCSLVLSIGLRATFCVATYSVSVLRLRWESLFEAADSHHKVLTKVLLRLMPASVFASLLDDSEKLIAENHGCCTTLLFELTSLQDWVSTYGGVKAFSMLNSLSVIIDKTSTNHGCRVIESVRGEVLIGAGVPEKDPEQVTKILNLAMDLRRHCRAIALSRGIPHEFKMGVCNGEVTVGPIGSVKRAFKFIGNVVSTSSRFKAACPLGEINVSESVHREGESSGFSFVANGNIRIRRTEYFSSHLVC